jgi:hypothetical protein
MQQMIPKAEATVERTDRYPTDRYATDRYARSGRCDPTDGMQSGPTCSAAIGLT